MLARRVVHRHDQFSLDHEDRRSRPPGGAPRRRNVQGKPPQLRRGLLRQTALRPYPANPLEQHDPLLLSQVRLVHDNALRLPN